MLYFFKKTKTPGEIIILHLRIKNLDDMIYSFWDIECDRLKLVSTGHFLLFYTSRKTQKKKEFWRSEKNCWRYHHFTHEVQFLRFGVRKSIWRCHHFTCVYQKSRSYNVCFLSIVFFSFWAIFHPFTPLMTLKIKIWKKYKKCLNILSFDTCTINEDHMMYGSWDLSCVR